ncbi:hypothetical protein VNO77_28627 [Canavalia gladiata]|uniref:t-SNARE coiled-coil homology domain-containing protein n=1 Tax=Canavalia gladiata TaxID=3824 RepID=A0AAN9QBA4_CANGL
MSLVFLYHSKAVFSAICWPRLWWPLAQHTFSERLLSFTSSIFCQLVKVTNATDHVRMGNDALQTAKSLQKKSRKCMMISIILLLVIAIIIVLAVLKPWNK